MRRLWAVLLIASYLLPSSACNRTPMQQAESVSRISGETATPTQPLPPKGEEIPPEVAHQPPPTTSASPSNNELARLIEQRLTQWGESVDPEAPDWIALDGANDLVIGGWVGVVESSAHKARTWFTDPRVTRLAFRKESRVNYQPVNLNPNDWYSELTRERYSSWPQDAITASSLAEGQWARQVNYHGRLVRFDRFATWGEKMNHVREWLGQRLGDRLLELKVSEDELWPSAFMVITADGHGEQERIEEAALLASWLVATRSAMVIAIRYEGAQSAKELLITHVGVIEWAKAVGDLTLANEWFEIDGRSSSKISTPLALAALRQRRKDLSALLDARSRLESLLPSGNQLLLGLTNGSWRHLVGIEATASPEQSWEQVWTTYAEVVDRMFMEAPGVEVVQLTVHRGDEVEFMRFDWNTWAVYHTLTKHGGVQVDPATITETAAIYRRYKPLIPPLPSYSLQ